MGLQTIIITNCKHLKRIKMFAFRNLPNLKTLIVANNPALSELEPHALGGLNRLDYLSVGQNNLSEIDGYVFSQSTSIKVIDFIGNPIKRIKNNAFHGLKNVSDLILSHHVNATPITVIEEDSFISTAFVDRIFLESIPMKRVQTNAFRGLSFCKNLLLSFSGVEEIEANAFFHANHIEKLSLHRSRLKRIHANAFNEMRHVETIDLRENYISKLNKNVFEAVVAARPSADHGGGSSSGQLARPKRLLLEQNPLHCDCNLAWILNNTHYLSQISLPEICAGPKGYDCLRLSELSIDSLACTASGLPINKPANELPCSDIVFDLNNKTPSDKDVYSISAQKPKATDNSDSDDAAYEEPDYDQDDPDYKTNDEEGKSQATVPILIASSIIHHPTTKNTATPVRPKWSNEVKTANLATHTPKPDRASYEQDEAVSPSLRDSDNDLQLVNKTRDLIMDAVNSTNSASATFVRRGHPGLVLRLSQSAFMSLASSFSQYDYSKLLLTKNLLLVECSISALLTYSALAFLLKDVLLLM